MNKKFIAFITGTSGAGKSTLVNNLKNMNLSNCEIHDFDEGGVPEGADENWRRERTNQWVNLCTENYSNGISTIICGVCVPNEIKACEKYTDSLNIAYGFIEISETVILERLANRSWDNITIENNINWAKYLKNSVLAEKNNFIVDGEKNTPTKVAEYVLEQLLHEKE